jgi:hypothetical protein
MFGDQAFGPVDPSARGRKLCAERTREADLFLVSGQGLQRRQNGAALAVLKTKDATPNAVTSREVEPPSNIAFGVVGLFERPILVSVASSIAAIAALPSTVLMFQVKLRKSRQ